MLQTLGSSFCESHDEAKHAPLPHWKVIALERQFPLSRLDLAFVQFATVMDLPGSERLNPHGALRTIRIWADRVKTYTEQNLWKFHRAPHQFENSEAYFRALCMVTVLQKEFGVRYNEAKIPLDVPFELEDVTIHGIVFGDGGTCVSLPVLFATIGRRLGYPIKTVHTAGAEQFNHQFARWDGDGVRFNIEATAQGLATPPDSHYCTGRYLLTPEKQQAGGYLASETTQAEMAYFLLERGWRLEDLGRRFMAAEAFAWALALNPTNVCHENTLKHFLYKWDCWYHERMPPGFPELKIGLPHGERFYPTTLPFEYEKRIFWYRSAERLLTQPDLQGVWEKMRRGQWWAAVPTPPQWTIAATEPAN